MKHLNNWAKRKPLGLVMIAQQFAVGVEPCFQFLKLIKSGDRIEAFSSLPKAYEKSKRTFLEMLPGTKG